MKVYINHGVGMNTINEEKTEWCCDAFKTWGHKSKEIYDGDMYLGEEPESIFHWDKLEFQKVNNGIMWGNGGFGDRFWGEKVKVCPFCGKKIERLQFHVNDIRWQGSRKKLAKAIDL